MGTLPLEDEQVYAGDWQEQAQPGEQEEEHHYGYVGDCYDEWRNVLFLPDAECCYIGNQWRRRPEKGSGKAKGGKKGFGKKSAIASA